jgi:hypothetical protein
MVNFRAVTPERLFQRMLSPNRVLGNQRRHHPHTWHRETDNRFQSYKAAISYHLTPYSRLDAKRACTIRAGNDKEEVVVFHGQIDSFSLGVSHAALRSHPYSTFTCSDDVYVLFSLAFFPLPYFASQEVIAIYAPSPFLFLSFSGTKG